MSRIATRRLLGLSSARPLAQSTLFTSIRALSSTAPKAAEDSILNLAKNISGSTLSSQPSTASSLASTLETSQPSTTYTPRSTSSTSSFTPLSGFRDNQGSQADRNEEPHHFHVFSHKHNCHITLTTPNRDPLISLSCGNLGFKKSQRKHYDSAFQLASYVLGRMKDMGLNAQIKKLEVSLRGFGQGREAVTKALLGVEGRHIRGKIVKVSDGTRLKFGGTRSPKPRRLG